MADRPQNSGLMADVSIDAIDELITRLKNAAASLDKLSTNARKEDQRLRLNGKAEGVRLAQSYLREMRTEWANE